MQPAPTPPRLDSRQLLAASIHRVLRREIPQRAAEDGLKASIDSALFEESRRNELTLAYLRVATTGAVLVSEGIGLLFNRSVVVGPVEGALAIVSPIVAAVWPVGVTAVVVALRNGWYRPWVRRLAPAADALMIVVAALLLTPFGSSPQGPAAGPAVAATLGTLLATSGALRLTRSAVYLSTALAAAAVAAVAVVLRLPLVWIVFLVAPVLLAGALGLIVTRLVRRALTNQVGRSAMDRLYGEAQQVIDARAEVLRVVSHDLRNPLNTIIMGTSSLLEFSLSEQQSKQLKIIKRAAERMNRLIQDLLNVSIIEAGRLTVDPRPTDLRALVAEVVDTLGPLAAEKSLQLEMALPAQLPEVRADAARILQVFSNLVGNAIKFTPERGRITLAAVVTGGSVRCDIIDTGPGIPQEQLPRIFGRFWQATRGDRRGIGLGLSIAKGIIDAHGERLWVTSNVGEGTIFSFTLAVA
jgi:signal transduction histidine kinase